MSDFTNVQDAGVSFASVELDVGVDFIPTGDQGSVGVITVGFGQGGFGDGPFGGSTNYSFNANLTQWTDIDTP